MSVCRTTPLLLSALLLPVLLLGGCSLDPETALHGRWYNEDVSVRFEPDGRLVYNSRSTGLLRGVYRFDASNQSLARADESPNLVLYFPGSQRTFSAEILMPERLQLTSLDRPGDRPTGRRAVLPSLVLKKAAPEETRSDRLAPSDPLASASQDRSASD